MSMTFRFANVPDAEEFSRWAIDNQDVPKIDIESAMKENNPTATFLVIEDEGKAVLYVPLFAVARIAYLGFNPESPARQRLEAMSLMLEAVKAFAANFGIKQVETLTKEGYSVAQWAEKHGFTPEDRQNYVLRWV